MNSVHDDLENILNEMNKEVKKNEQEKERTNEQDKMSYKSLLEKGNMFYNESSYTKAAEFYSQAITLDSNRQPAKAGLAQCFYKQSLLTKSLTKRSSLLRSASKLDPSNYSIALEYDEITRGVKNKFFKVGKSLLPVGLTAALVGVGFLFNNTEGGAFYKTVGYGFVAKTYTATLNLIFRKELSKRLYTNFVGMYLGIGSLTNLIIGGLSTAVYYGTNPSMGLVVSAVAGIGAHSFLYGWSKAIDNGTIK